MTQRERFEVWCESEHVNTVKDAHGYLVMRTELLWDGWRAAEAAALERIVDLLLDMANGESTIEYKWAADAIRTLDLDK